MISAIPVPHDQSKVENARTNTLCGLVEPVAAVALLVIAALGASGHLSAYAVGATFIGVGVGCPLLRYVSLKCKGDQEANLCMTLIQSAIPFAVGAAAMTGRVSLSGISGVALAASSLYLIVKLCYSGGQETESAIIKARIDEVVVRLKGLKEISPESYETAKKGCFKPCERWKCPLILLGCEGSDAAVEHLCAWKRSNKEMDSFHQAMNLLSEYYPDVCARVNQADNEQQND